MLLLSIQISMMAVSVILIVIAAYQAKTEISIWGMLAFISALTWMLGTAGTTLQ